MLACCGDTEGHIDCIKILQKKGIITQKTVEGNSLLHLACQSGSNATIQHLLSLKIDTLISSKNEAGQTPIEILAE